MKHIIVGVDPGKTAAIACLDMDGRVLHIAHSRFAGFSWFVDLIKTIGIPVIIASDKKRSTHMTNRVAAAFGSRTYLPAEDISAKKKEAIVSGFRIENAHERDALVAAIAAYNAFSNKFKQAERFAKERGYENVDRLKAMVVKKYSIYETITNKKAGKRA